MRSASRGRSVVRSRTGRGFRDRGGVSRPRLDTAVAPAGDVQGIELHESAAEGGGGALRRPGGAAARGRAQADSSLGAFSWRFVSGRPALTPVSALVMVEMSSQDSTMGRPMMTTDAKKPQAMTMKIQNEKYVLENVPAGVESAGQRTQNTPQPNFLIQLRAGRSLASESSSGSRPLWSLSRSSIAFIDWKS